MASEITYRVRLRISEQELIGGWRLWVAKRLIRLADRIIYPAHITLESVVE